MVASQNVDFGGANGLANFLQDQQRQIDELSRQSRYPFSAGPMGTFQIYPDPTITDANGKPVVDTVLSYGDGTPALSIQPGKAVYGSKQQMAMYDLDGTVMYSTDEVAGYGLSNPAFSYHMSGIESAGSPLPSTSGTAVVVAQGHNYVYNPAWHVMCRLRFANGATTADAVATFKVVDIDGTVYGTTSFTFAGINANTIFAPTFEKMILLPATAMRRRCYGEINVYATTGAANLSVQAFPILSVGISRAWYDNLPSLH